MLPWNVVSAGQHAYIYQMANRPGRLLIRNLCAEQVDVVVIPLGGAADAPVTLQAGGSTLVFGVQVAVVYRNAPAWGSFELLPD